MTVSGRGKVVAFIGSRGGAGTTTIATNVAVGIASYAHARTALVDLDVGGTILDHLLDLPAEAGGTVVDLAPAITEVGGDAIGDEVVAQAQIAHSSGLRVLLASRGIDLLRIDGDAVRKLLRIVARANEVVIIDVPSILDQVALAAIEAADTVLLVTTPEVTSLKRAKALLQRVRAIKPQTDAVRVVLAQADRSGGVPLWEIETFLGVTMWSVVPTAPEEASRFHDRRVIPVLDLGGPLGKALHLMAHKLHPLQGEAAISEASRPGEGTAPALGASDRPTSVGAPVLRARLTVTKGGSGKHELEGRAYVIGRSSSADIALADPSVSGRHAQVSPCEGQFAIVDLGSTNGTTVDGRALDGEHVLRGGETIGIGDARLRYEVLM